jgi:tetratricopeptide (TPR) repeat protein
MKKAVLFVLLLFCANYHSTAQVGEPDPNESWRKRLETAEKQEKLGNFSIATAYYLSVIESKSKREDLAYKIGELGLKARRYDDVITAVKPLAGNKKFPKAEYYLGMAFKGIGDYKSASAAFDAFSDNYRGNDYQIMTDRANREMEGCSLGNDARENRNIKITHLTKMVNTPQKEFAPIPFGEDILYFSSNGKKATKIFRTEKMGRTWKEPLEPVIFGSMEKEHFCGGSFTPNKSRFYFSQCDIVNGEYQCEIYVMQRVGQEWSKPKKLPDYINKEGYTATDPFVYVEKGQEILYFSSDREGGAGGKDIWFAIKDYDSEDLNFDIPVNLGEAINTTGDEISPFYQSASRTLYFSSNGQVSIGGFDIYKSEGSMEVWKNIEHLGKPLNSSADDTYFVMGANESSGFISSNRAFGSDKTSTDNDDLFSFNIKAPEISLEGKIHEMDNPAKLVQNVMVSLYEITNTGEYALTSNISPDGYYSFFVKQNRRYKIELEITGYENASFAVDMDDYKDESTIVKNLDIKSNFTEDIREEVPGDEEPIVDVEPTIGDGIILPPGTRQDKPDEEEIRPGPPGTRPGKEIDPVKDPKKPGNRTTPITESSDNEPDPDVNENPDEEEPTVIAEQPIEEAPSKPQFTKPKVVDTKPQLGEKLGGTDSNGQPIILKERKRGELTVDQMENTIMVNGKEYLPVDGGYWKIVEPVEDPNFPGIEVGLDQHYRIQLAAVSSYKAYKFDKALNALNGTEITLETATSREGKEVTRVMVMKFSNFNQAKSALRKLRKQGYDRAFIIRYNNNRRTGRMIRDID